MRFLYHIEQLIFQMVKLLEKLVVQHDIRASFGGRTTIRTPSLYVYFFNLLGPVLQKMVAACEGGYQRA